MKDFTEKFPELYVDESRFPVQKERCLKILNTFEHPEEVMIFSAPGRTEICGNHTDHQHGHVLAAAVNLDALAFVTKSDKISIISDGKALPDIDDSAKRDDEKGTSESLVRGMVQGFKDHGLRTGGFQAVITSDVLVGAGLSSSACFEVLIGTILSHLYNDGQVDPVTIAKIGQYAENEYFGKPCGLMDQCACACGGLVAIDFENPSEPVVTPLAFDLAGRGYSLCVVDTAGSHADLTAEYAAVPAEMSQVAACFGKSTLREVDFPDFLSRFQDVRASCGDRAALRAWHFFKEDERAVLAAKALVHEDLAEFLHIIQQSGDSSFKYLQNVYAPKDYKNQSIAVALALAEHFLAGQGVCRVHGGGFAGTILAIMKNEARDRFVAGMEKALGPGCCHVLQVRPAGGVRVA